jgi:murein DD-endopeptidase MepM/ murein hydrolase activator NlpD
LLSILSLQDALCAEASSPKVPLFQTVDLNKGESTEVNLPEGSRLRIKLVNVQEVRDTLRSAVREARAVVEVNGRRTNLFSGNYHLPVTLGEVQVDCPVTQGYYRNHDSFEDSWGMVKDARVRLWPARSSWFEAGKFVYPAKQRWFASATQIGNEPSYVDGGDRPPGRSIYYHSGNDIGGCEGLTEVVAACDGLVVSAAGKALPDHADAPFYKPRGDYDYVYVLDAHGWYYRYAHLQSIEPTVQPGKLIKAGEKIGVLGKEGSSGGWAHLHFDIKAKQPSGQWGIQDAYPFLWEAYQRERHPDLMAVARPHHLAEVGERVVLDGSGSWSRNGKIAGYQWTLSDGTSTRGARVERRYDKPGTYSEVLKVSGDQGRADYDFAIVQVLARGSNVPPTIHAAYAPTFGIRAGDPVTFKVRTFRTTEGKEVWDFGDGSSQVEVRSDGNAQEHAKDGYAVTQHRYAKPGDYIARVERSNERSEKAVAHLLVHVE